MNLTSEDLNKISAAIVHCALTVHKELGPGLLESVYEACLIKELTDNGWIVRRQVPLPIYYKGEKLNVDFRIDLLVEEKVIVELKAVEIMLPVFNAQLLTYLKLSEKKLGLLINFNVALLKEGIKRIIL
jgi:GxxExxY protein